LLEQFGKVVGALAQLPQQSRFFDRDHGLRSEKCTEQHQPGALDRCVKRCVCFGGRRLDEHKPAEWRDRRVGREHLVAGEIVRLLHLLGGRIPRLARAADLS
jgi:hypothetical protein